MLFRDNQNGLGAPGEGENSGLLMRVGGIYQAAGIRGLVADPVKKNIAVAVAGIDVE